MMAERRKIDWVTLFLSVTALVLLVLAGIKVLSGGSSGEVTPIRVHENWPEILADEVISTGPNEAEVTLIEFYNYGCVFCRMMDSSLTNIRRKHTDALRVIYIPLHMGSYGSALMDARAAWCAEEQQTFDRVHELLYRPDEGPRDWEAIAGRASLPDPEAFTACTNSKRFDPVIEHYESVAKEQGVPGVPYFIINGKAYIGSYPQEILEQLVDRELK